MNDERARKMSWSQVRHQIDRDETGDKKAATDPAAAPLGTDAEAGGIATGGEHVARSAAAEQAGRSERAAAQGREVERPRRVLAALSLAGVGLVSVVIALAVVLAR